MLGSMIYLSQTPSNLKTFNNTPSGHVQLSPQGSVMIAICDIFLCLKKMQTVHCKLLIEKRNRLLSTVLDTMDIDFFFLDLFIFILFV